MNHISRPRYLAERVEDETYRLVAETNQAWGAYKELVRRFKEDFARLEWPIGFPAKHFDPHHVPSLLDDTLEEMPAQQLREIANNKAWELLE